MSAKVVNVKDADFAAIASVDSLDTLYPLVRFCLACCLIALYLLQGWSGQTAERRPSFINVHFVLR